MTHIFAAVWNGLIQSWKPSQPGLKSDRNTAFELVEINATGAAYKIPLPKRNRDSHEQNIAETGAFCHVQDILMKLMKSDETLLDLGANLGAVAIPLAMQGINVIAYDISPENIAALRLGTEVNGLSDRIQVREAAAWHKRGKMKFGGARSLCYLADYGDRRVKAVKLDDDLKWRGPVHAVKMDIEGTELYALTGLTRIIKRWRPHIVFEVWPEGLARYNHSAEKLFRFLEDRGYFIYRLCWKVLAPRSFPPEQIVTDYLATTLPEQALSEHTGYAIRPLADDEIVYQIKHQYTLNSEPHLIYLLAIIDCLPRLVREHPDVKSLVTDLNARYAGHWKIEHLRKAVMSA